jgi:hypothetical protein
VAAKANVVTALLGRSRGAIAMKDADVKIVLLMQQLGSGRVGNVGDIANMEGVDVTHVRRLLRLVLLAPRVIENIMATDGKGVTLHSLLRQSLPADWRAQEAVLCH